MREERVRVTAAVLWGLLLVAAGLGPVAQAQPVGQTETIRTIESLVQASERLQNRYGRPVTYEAPVWRWRGDFDVYPPARGGPEVWRVKIDTLRMPEGLTPDKTPVLDAAALTKVLAAYHEQNPERGRFRVVESGRWLQIVPSQVRDESGALKPAGSLLDTIVSVPVLSRSASEHLIALCQAVSSASGVTLEPNVSASPGDSFNQAFAANGYILPGHLRPTSAPLNDDDLRPYILFDWGAPAETAREALLDLMNRAGTTLSWHLRCQHGGHCQLGMVTVGAPGRNGTTMLSLDRCTNCRPVPGAPWLGGPPPSSPAGVRGGNLARPDPSQNPPE